MTLTGKKTAKKAEYAEKESSLPDVIVILTNYHVKWMMGGFIHIRTGKSRECNRKGQSGDRRSAEAPGLF